MCFVYCGVNSSPFTVFLSISPHRTENTEANLPESQEFLSGVEDKKTTRFTDVRETIGFSQWYHI